MALLGNTHWIVWHHFKMYADALIYNASKIRVLFVSISFNISLWVNIHLNTVFSVKSIPLLHMYNT